MTQTVRIVSQVGTVDSVTVMVGEPGRMLIDVTRYDVQFPGGIIDPMRIQHWDNSKIPAPKPGDKFLYQDVEPDQPEEDGLPKEDF